VSRATNSAPAALQGILPLANDETR
jgi:hypothetical protein